MNIKKMILAVACLMATFMPFAPVAKAAPFQATCTVSPTLIANGNGVGSLACPALDAGAGFTLGTVTLSIASDYLNGPIGTTLGTSVLITYTPDGTGTPFGPHNTLVSGGFSSNSFLVDSLVPVGPTPWAVGTMNVNTQTLAGFNLAITSAVQSGFMSTSSANAFLSGNTVAIPQQGDVPEPGTWAMMLGGLGAMVIFRRQTARG